MTLIDQIEEWVYEYESRTGHKPNVVSVPKWRIPQLVEEARAFGHNSAEQVTHICGALVKESDSDAIEVSHEFSRHQHSEKG